MKHPSLMNRILQCDESLNNADAALEGAIDLIGSFLPSGAEETRQALKSSEDGRVRIKEARLALSLLSPVMKYTGRG